MRFSLCAALLFLSTPLFAATPATHPNIVFLFADDLGWTDIATGSTNFNNGNTYAQTPAIDHLATEGMSFSNMHTCPNCAPARASLMTGQYAVQNGVYNVGSLDRGTGSLEPATQRSQHITREAVTFAETLKTAGYITCHVGKFHVSTHEEVTQFDGFDFDYGGGKKGDGTPHGYFAIHDPKSSTGWSFVAMAQEMDVFATPYTKEYIDQNLKPYANNNDPSVLVGTPKHLTDADADAAIDFMTKHLASPDKDKPFFINVAFNAIHAAVRSRRDLISKYNKIKSHDPRHPKADFAALIEGEDQAIARILKFLDDNHLSDNTLVIFMSDNGGSAASTHNDPLRGYKGMFYEGGLRVPSIARLPGVIKPGTTTDQMVNMVDFYPTFCDFAGAKLPDPSVHRLDGLSFAPLLRGETDESPRTVTYYHFPGYLDTRAFPCSTIIKKLDDHKNYKLIYSYEDQHYELYNLTDDLSEKSDLLKDGKPTPDNQKIAINLRDDLYHYLDTSHPLMAKSKTTHQPVPLPIPLDDALHSGNHISRSPFAPTGEAGGSD
ncbi:MAG TPA: sulfatase-like hydrolase/transferase [Tepidisphaeraceae bacterium]|jgi:arylsulfatase A-like enzyme|nr:sulfatase-like hydrolase/transferase [Tepidisphaeraceae bacterium]